MVNYQSSSKRPFLAVVCLVSSCFWALQLQQCTVGHIRRLSKGFRVQEWHRLIVWLSSISCVTWTKVVNSSWWSVKANPQHAMLPLYTPDTFSCYIHTPIESLSQPGQLLYPVSQVSCYMEWARSDPVTNWGFLQHLVLHSSNMVTHISWQSLSPFFVSVYYIIRILVNTEFKIAGDETW